VNRSVVFRHEESEARMTISLRAMNRIANAMDCKVVYAVIPRDGGTLEEMAERRKWEKVLGVRGQGVLRAGAEEMCPGCGAGMGGDDSQVSKTRPGGTHSWR
jgi:hypothetical protein